MAKKKLKIYGLFDESYLENVRHYMKGWQSSHLGNRSFMIYRGPGPMVIFECMADGRMLDRTRGNVPKRFRRVKPKCALCGDAAHVLTYGDFYKVPCPKCQKKAFLKEVPSGVVQLTASTKVNCWV